MTFPPTVRWITKPCRSSVAPRAAPWVFGWISPYVDTLPSFGPVINFYQINNYADQMINQYQMVSVSNTAPNSNVNVTVDESSVNNRLF